MRLFIRNMLTMNWFHCFLSAVSVFTFFNCHLCSSIQEAEVLPEKESEPFYYPMPEDTTAYEYSYSSHSKQFEDKQTGSVTFKNGATKVEVQAAVENTDFISQCRAQRQASQKKKTSHNGSKSRSQEDDEEDYSPKASVSVKWSNKDN